MNPLLLQSLYAWFRDYAARFAEADGSLHPMQELKLAHSLRVAANARTIAEGLGWDAPACLLGEACGLLHDAGRFSQYAEFRTFEDRRSVNHAVRSHEVLCAAGVLDALPAPDRAALLDAVRFHNGHTVPAALTPASAAFVHLVRDADKLDIFYVFNDAIRHRKLDLYPEITLHVELDGPPSPEVIAAVRARQPIAYAQIRSLVDFLLVQLVWIYELHYIPSLRLARERQVIEQLRGHLPPTDELRELAAAVARFAEERTGYGAGPAAS